MADIHNAIKYGTAILNAARIAAGISADASGLERLDESLTVGLDLWERDEWAYLRQEILWGVFTFQAAVLAEFGFVGVGNNTTNQLLIVDGCTARAAAAVALHHNPRATLAATGTAAATAVARDQRASISSTVPLQRIPPIEVWSGTDLAALSGFPIEEINPLTQDYRQFQSGPWIVRPGGVLTAQAGTVNLGIGVNFWGRLRMALPGEIPNP